MIVYPTTTSGDKMSAVMLFCVVDSNPPPKYYWTKGNSREVRHCKIYRIYSRISRPKIGTIKLALNLYTII